MPLRAVHHEINCIRRGSLQNVTTLISAAYEAPDIIPSISRYEGLEGSRHIEPEGEEHERRVDEMGAVRSPDRVQRFPVALDVKVVELQCGVEERDPADKVLPVLILPPQLIN